MRRDRVFNFSMIALLLVATLSWGGTARAEDGRGGSTSSRIAEEDAVASDSLDGPEAVAAAYLDAFRRTDWEGCARLMHPDALQALKDVLIRAAEADSSSGIPDALYGDNTPRETIRFAPPAELYARMLRVVYQKSPQATEVLDGLSSKVIGHVDETDTLVHVIARTHVDGRSGDERGQALSQIEVFSLERYQESWRLRLTTDVKNVARAVQKRQ
ncbi:hypothetical protein CRI94_08415 [Longibacter salinarum]|uniref:SnoaL-like domain-containing protein n=1 Tax=Longibacter salinarum TaxID=1850348 RepID=A0A2A8CZJ8_9BACT|nr:hypothetical protein [Longibacter salinarum]PEN14054.1 hypothetical protein CRI94_08415 [Longibacter salinarum]